MRKVPKKFKFASAILAVIGFAVWQFTPLQAIFAISNLSDPAKLATLGERGANSRLNKIVFWLDVARNRGMGAETAISWAQTINGTGEPRASLVKAELARNLQIADELGLLTAENRDRLKRGNAAIVTRGPYTGETVEIDHIVPISLAPEVGNELANLEMLPKTLNRKKSNQVGERQLSYAEKLCTAGMVSKESLEKVQQRAAP
jgi:5-methylcytosine-specific restriction endonuclease McrA